MRMEYCPALIAAQRLEAVARKPSQVVQRGRGVQDRQPLLGLLRKALEVSDKLTCCELLGLSVSVAQDHYYLSV